MKHTPALRSFLLASSLLGAANSAHAQTWDGGSGANANWQTLENWSPDGTPVWGDTASILFNATTSTAQLTNFLGTASTIGSLTFDGMNSAVSIRLATTSGGGTAAHLTLGSASVAPTITVNDSATNSSNLVHTIGVSNGSVVLANNLTVDVNSILGPNQTSLTINRPITGGFGLTKEGSGLLTLQGATSVNNTYTGKTVVNGGRVRIYNGAGLGANPASFVADQLTLDGGSLYASGVTDFGNRGITLGAGGGGFIANNGASMTVNVPITGGGGLTQETFGGTGYTLTLTGKSTYSGNTTINGGTLDLSTANARIYDTGTFNTQVVTVNTGGTLKVANFGVGATSQSLGQLAIDAGRVVVNGGAIQFAGNVSNPRAITVGANGATLEVLSGKTFTMNTPATPNAYTDNAALTLAGDGTGILEKDVTGTGVSVVKSGAGSWTLSGTNNTYTGATTIKAGTLKINTSTTIGSSSQITVGDTGSSGTILDVTTAGITVGSTQTLAGIGTVLATGQTVTVNGTLAPGNSPGTLTIDGGTLALANATGLDFELNPADLTVGGGVNDLVSVLGNLTLDGVLNVTPTSGDFTSAAINTAWRLFTYTGTLNNNTLSFGSMPALGAGLDWSIDTATTGQVNLVVVPEPRAALLGSLGLLALLRRRRA